MDNQVKGCPWESVDDFVSLSEFNCFVAWMNDQIKNGLAVEIPVISPYIGASAFQEKWFKHVESEQVWRLVWPDGPFRGLFERVE